MMPGKLLPCVSEVTIPPMAPQNVTKRIRNKLTVSVGVIYGRVFLRGWAGCRCDSTFAALSR